MITKEIIIRKTTYKILFATDMDEWKEGLKGEKLEHCDGLLMVFPDDRKVNITMRDMIYSIDILWIDAEKKITRIYSNVEQLDKNGDINWIDGEVCRYLLELPAGKAITNNLSIGDQVIF